MKEEFVHLAQQAKANMRGLCRSYGISLACGYKWLRRYEQQGRRGLEGFFSWKKIGFLDLHDPWIKSTYRPALCRPRTSLQPAEAVFDPSLSPGLDQKPRYRTPPTSDSP